MLVAPLLAAGLALVAPALVAPAQAEVYALADAGITLDLPAGWEMTRWSDWDFNGKTRDGSVAIDAWTTSFQVPVTKESANGWAVVYREKLEEMRAENVVMDTVTLADLAGQPTARTRMRFSFEKGGPKGVMEVAAFAVDGQIVHVSVLAAGSNVGRATTALDTLLARLTVQKPAGATVALGGAATTELGFSVTLPEGWRRPLPSEEKPAMAALADIGIGPSTPETCLRAIRPRPNGDVDLVLFCAETWKMGILDDDSFADQEALLKQRFFGKAWEMVPAATRVDRTDRIGYLLTPEIKGKDLRIAALPYDRGTVVAWGVGEHGSADALGAAIQSISQSLEFDGVEGGASVHEAGEWVVHTLTYRPFHPVVVGAALGVLVVLGGIATLVFRKRP